MKNFHILQLIGFIVEIFSFVALVISLFTDNVSRGPLYLLFLVGIVLIAAGTLIKGNKK